MRRMRYRLRLLVGLTVCLLGCSERMQVGRVIGEIHRPSGQSVEAELEFVDEGDWTLFAFIEDPGTEVPWPETFSIGILHRGAGIVEKTVRLEESAPEKSQKYGHRKLYWRADTLHPPFASNIDDNGLLPIDRLLKQGERHLLRVTLPPGPEVTYDVIVVNHRDVYWWE